MNETDVYRRRGSVNKYISERVAEMPVVIVGNDGWERSWNGLSKWGQFTPPYRRTVGALIVSCVKAFALVFYERSGDWGAGPEHAAARKNMVGKNNF